MSRVSIWNVRMLCVATLVLWSAGDSLSAEDGLPKRAPWITSRVKGSPEPPAPYVVERAFPRLQFNRCLDMATPPGGGRVYVAEQGGKIFSFEDRQDVERADLVLDLKKAIPDARSVYALTFHPSFQTNRFIYVCYIKAPNQPHGTQVARFTVSESDPPTIDPATELPLITWLSGGHNGCCLKFGPDGYLYISTGDAAPPNPPDSKRAGQDVSNLLSAILRIDVDETERGRNYRIPDDNPFVDLENARGEIWAYGFRNPWRMSFDERTGDLWVGDVGWELWEMLDRVERGGNYGWSIMEGRQLTQPEWPRGPTPILPPTIDHAHSESSSITDGLTYYGKRLKGLYGKHIYGDYDTGKIWAFRWSNDKVSEHQEIADTTLRIVGFGAGGDGECYLIDHLAGHLYRLAPNPQRDETSRFPIRLSETGLFTDVENQEPAPGVVPYFVSTPRWADHAQTQRWVATPGDGVIKPTDAKYQFPANTVLAKTLSLEMDAGDPESSKRVETQLLHYDGNAWNPYTYRWNDEQTDATLVGRNGLESTLHVKDASAPGGERRQVWRFAGRGECQRCHNPWSGPPLAFDSAQLNLERLYDGKPISQLSALAQIGLLSGAPAKQAGPQLVDPTGDAELGQRARSYLHANCAHCHRLHAGSSVLSYMHYDLPLDKTNMTGARPMQGAFGLLGAKVVAPGDPLRSVLHYRMAKLGGGRMPHIGSTEVDSAGVDLIYRWIESLDPQTTSDATGLAAHKQHQRQVALLAQFREQRNDDAMKQLLTTTSGALMVLRAMELKQVDEARRDLVVAAASESDNTSVRDLFERFLPPEKRSRRLGAAVAAKTILSLKGDPVRGEKLFFAGNVQCKSCHQIGDRGAAVGPPLTTIGKKLDRTAMLESILEPSKRIDSQYLNYLVEMKDGRLQAGLLVRKNATEIVLKDAKQKTHRFSPDQVERVAPQGKSMMPELLLRDMTAQQAADLLAYLGSLK